MEETSLNISFDKDDEYNEEEISKIIISNIPEFKNTKEKKTKQKNTR